MAVINRNTLVLNGVNVVRDVVTGTAEATLRHLGRSFRRPCLAASHLLPWTCSASG